MCYPDGATVISQTILTCKVALIYNLLHLHINSVTCGEHMTYINVLDERLHLGSLLDLLLGHALCNLACWAVNSSNKAVSEAVLLARRILVIGLYNNGLLSGMASGKDNNNFSALCNIQKTTLNG